MQYLGNFIETPMFGQKETIYLLSGAIFTDNRQLVSKTSQIYQTYPLCNRKIDGYKERV